MALVRVSDLMPFRPTQTFEFQVLSNDAMYSGPTSIQPFC